MGPTKLLCGSNAMSARNEIIILTVLAWSHGDRIRLTDRRKGFGNLIYLARLKRTAIFADYDVGNLDIADVDHTRRRESGGAEKQV